MAEQLNTAPEDSEKRELRRKGILEVTSLFHQVTHDIRVPVTGLKMLWPMIKEVSKEEQEEVFSYLQNSSYELFSLIENLCLVLIDFEHLAEDLERVHPEHLIDEMATKIGAPIILQANLQKNVLKIRQGHFKQCLEICLSLCMQAKASQSAPVKVSASCKGRKLSLQFIAPTLEEPDDGHTAEIHYSLFSKPKGNSQLNGFMLLRIRNLVAMVDGEFTIASDEEGTKIQMILPTN